MKSIFWIHHGEFLLWIKYLTAQGQNLDEIHLSLSSNVKSMYWFFFGIEPERVEEMERNDDNHEADAKRTLMTFEKEHFDNFSERIQPFCQMKCALHCVFWIYFHWVYTCQKKWEARKHHFRKSWKLRFWAFLNIEVLVWWALEISCWRTKKSTIVRNTIDL